ncbi:MAG TPA: polysaccharide deacetylase family protein [Isosphaeraceae bacterium]|nr:polysaccharide deacetylase family protein [Isosphaeraceae bacterium]
MSALPILNYHAIDASGSVIATDPAHFAATMAALHGAGLRAIDLGDWIARGRPEVDRAFALTFDDGLASVARAADFLARYDWPATVFLVAGRMGLDNAWPDQPRSIPRSPLLAWSDLPALASAGLRFGAHTMSHLRLDRLDDARLEAELRDARKEIEDRLGTPCPLFAYPYGIAPARVRRAAARHYVAALGTRLDVASSEEDVFALPRVDAFYLRSRRTLRGLISGRWRGRLRLLRMLRTARAWVTTPAGTGHARTGPRGVPFEERTVHAP